MEFHGIHTDGVRKEITCKDCGHAYGIVEGQRSSACSVCGNIEYFGTSSKEKVSELTAAIVSKRVLPRLSPKEKPDPLAVFRTLPDSAEVETIRCQYQVEWQLWAALVKHFENPVYHSAFLCNAITENRLEQATALYREHRSVMALLEDSRWQAQVADLMLERIEAVALARMPNYRGWYDFDLPSWLLVLPASSWLVKVSWIAFGVFMVSRFLHLGG